MGILATPASEPKPATAKRKSTGIDLSGLKPLSATGTKNFAGYRDSTLSPPSRKPKSGKAKDDDAMDSDADDEEETKFDEDAEEVEPKPGIKGLLSPEDARRQGELAEGVRKIKVYY